MRTVTTLLTISLVLTTQFLLSCSSSVDNSAPANAASVTNTASNAANSANDNVEELGMLATLPLEPEEASWKETNAPDGKRKLTAVIRYSGENAAKIAAQAGQHRAAVPVELSTEEWYPSELISQSELSGDTMLKGQSYAADDFYREPYNDGKLTRVENTDVFILELTAR